LRLLKQAPRAPSLAGEGQRPSSLRALALVVPGKGPSL